MKSLTFHNSDCLANYSNIIGNHRRQCETSSQFMVMRMTDLTGIGVERAVEWGSMWRWPAGWSARRGGQESVLCSPMPTIECACLLSSPIHATILWVQRRRLKFVPNKRRSPGRERTPCCNILRFEGGLARFVPCSVQVRIPLRQGNTENFPRPRDHP